MTALYFPSPASVRSRFSAGLSRKLGPIVLCLLAGCEGQRNPAAASDPAVAAAAQAQQVAAIPKPPSYERELEGLNAGIETGLRLGAERPDNGQLALQTVSVYLERARLTGNYADFDNAEALLKTQESQGAKSASACMVWAKLHFTLHRLKRARAALSGCPPTDDKMEVAALHADIEFYSGRYKAGATIHTALVNQIGRPAHYISLALLRNKMGAPGEAAAFLEAAEKRYHGNSATLKAWLKLQRGLIALERGRLDEALAMYRLAEDALPGWWLIDEHIAEVKNLSGDIQGARTLYEDVIRRTGLPEYMDALAAIESLQGKEGEAKKLLARARLLYEERLARFPEAAAGHALAHFLQDASDPQRALELAEMNFSTRPYGEAAIALARAMLLNGKPKAAIPLLEAQLAAGWDNAEMYWVLSAARRSAGDAARAARASGEALRRNPYSAKMYPLAASAP